MTDTQIDFQSQNLESSLDKAWELLREATRDRHSPLHNLSVATVSADSMPRQRIMVLRETNSDGRFLRFNTDVRASKVLDLQAHDNISILGYHPAAKVQLRLSGKGRIETNSGAADAAWDAASLYGKRCYLADPAPGTRVDEPISGLDARMEGRKPEPEEVISARENFAILIVQIERIEWLYLAHTGHRRAIFSWDDSVQSWSHDWLVP